MTGTNLWTITENEICNMGISTTYKGFYYLVYAVILAVQIGTRKASLSKDIYERIADINCVSSESVEKCIRNSIVKAWMSDGTMLSVISPESSRKPTNGEVIAFISDRIRLESGIGFW